MAPYKCSIFRWEFRTFHLLFSHCSASLWPPRASDSTCWGCLSCIRKEFPHCPKPFIWLLWPVFTVPLKPALRDSRTLSTLSIKKRLPPHESGRVCPTLCVTYHCFKPFNMTLMPLAFPWLQMQFLNTYRNQLAWNWGGQETSQWQVFQEARERYLFYLESWLSARSKSYLQPTFTS